MRWALGTLDPEWHELIEHAQALRKGDEATSMRPADPTAMDATRAFVDYCIDWATRSEL